MTHWIIFDAAHWQQRAAEMRKMAEATEDFYNKHLMIKMAESYDKLAARALERAQK